jgi:hypothetical protein
VSAQRVFFDTPQINKRARRALRRRNQRGQALVEYVLLVAVVSIIFGFMFGVIRRNLFNLWVCELYPRIAAPRSCDKTEDCFNELEPIDQCAP